MTRHLETEWRIAIILLTLYWGISATRSSDTTTYLLGVGILLCSGGIITITILHLIRRHRNANSHRA